jgi:hypothetical protein
MHPKHDKKSEIEITVSHSEQKRREANNDTPRHSKIQNTIHNTQKFKTPSSKSLFCSERVKRSMSVAAIHAH